jgi:hypothetical protein
MVPNYGCFGRVAPTYAPVLILQDARVVKTVILTTGERWGSVVSLSGYLGCECYVCVDVGG